MKNDNLIGFLVYGIIIFGVIIYLAFYQQKPTIQNTYYVPTAIPTIYNCNTVHQYYLYCWDNGDPSPHHLGYRVYGDHFCTDRELGKCQ